MLCSRVSFRLSVRQAVSRVILRGSALRYFTQRPIRAHQSNHSRPQFTDEERITVYLWGIKRREFDLKAIYTYLIIFWTVKSLQAKRV